MRRIRPLLTGCLLAVPALAAQAAPRVEESCRASALREDRLEAVGPRGEMVLASGARAILAGLHWPETDSEAAEASAWLMRHRGRPLTLSAFGAEDRWGRAPVEAFADPASEEDEPVDLAAGLIAAGLAAVDAGESDVLCRPDLLALEAAPRAGGRGVWRVPVHDARDGPGLAALAGRFVVAEGRVVHVGERPARTYLDFARRGGAGLSVTVPKRTWRTMSERGLSASRLRGRLARVRGRVEIRRGPTIEIVGAGMIEIVEGEQAQAR